jgi:hypothetical protein
MALRARRLLVFAVVACGCGRQELWSPSTGTGSGGGTAGGSGAGGDPIVSLDVGSLPGLVLWLDATRGVSENENGKVTSWHDQSPAGVDLAPKDAPSANYAALGDAAPPGVELLASSTLSTPGAGAVGIGTGDFLVEIVAASWPGYDLPHLLEIDNLTEASLAIASDPGGHTQAAIFGGDGAVTSKYRLDQGGFHLIGVRRFGRGNEATLIIRDDGASQGARAGPSFAYDFGSFSSFKLGPAVDLAEVVVLRGPIITDDDVAKLEAFLLAKHGLR